VGEVGAMTVAQLIYTCVACFASMVVARLSVTLMRFAIRDTMFPEFSRDAQRAREAEFFIANRYALLSPRDDVCTRRTLPTLPGSPGSPFYSWPQS
jgi:hypothetical protein